MGFNIEKGKEATEDRLRKFGFGVLKDDSRDGFKARVRIAMDASGSTKDMWLDGRMQQAIQATFSTALAVDDDGALPVAVFNDGEMYTLIDSTMTRDNYETYVKDHIMHKVPMFNGTDYSYVIQAILEDENFYQHKQKFFGGEKITLLANPNDCPTLLYFFTDGACSETDTGRVINLLTDLQNARSHVYVLFVGIGYPEYFTFIQRLADKFENVGFANVQDINEALGKDPHKVSELLLPEEMLNWLKK